MNRCIECGHRIGPHSHWCRTHASSHAREAWKESRQAVDAEHMSRLAGLKPSEIAADLMLSPTLVNASLSDTYRNLRLGPTERACTVNQSERQRAIARLGARLASELMADKPEPLRAAFFELRKDSAVPVVELEDGLQVRGRRFPISEHPTLAEIAATGKPCANMLSTHPVGPRTGQAIARARLMSGAGVPITQSGRLVGILAIGSRRRHLPRT